MINNKGSLLLILGCMFSGKSTAIIHYARKYKAIKKKILIIKHIYDNRYADNHISSHNLDKEPCITMNDLNNSFDDDKYKNADIIIIEEAQFFKSLVIPINKMVDIHNKTVIVCGLNGDFKRNNFGDIRNLLPYVDNIHYCKALCSICNNGTEAIFSKKITDNNNQVDIGSNDSYIPVCREHYNS